MNRKEIFMRNSARQVFAEIQSEKQAQNAAVQSFVKDLPVEQKISQIFLVNIVGCDKFMPVEFSGALKGEYGKGNYLVPGGCLFFSYNIAQTPEKMMEFNKSIRDFCLAQKIVPPYLALDQEGGFVNRLRQIAGPLPSCQRVKECLSVEQAYDLYSLQAVQMSLLGFHLNLAPVVEVKNENNKDFLDDRSFGSLEDVLRYGYSTVNGFENFGIGSVLKHFPGNTNTDPHTGLPEIFWNQEELNKNILVPFESLSGNASGILMSHARLAIADSQTPACLSSYWVNDVLRDKFGYEGLIFSDDIFMAALQENGFPPDKAAVMAIEAGIDCIMLSEKKFAPIAKILLDKSAEDEKFGRLIEKAVIRIINWKISKGILELYKDSANEWKVRPVQFGDINQKLNAYISVLQENIELYRTYFMKNSSVLSSGVQTDGEQNGKN